MTSGQVFLVFYFMIFHISLTASFPTTENEISNQPLTTEKTKEILALPDYEERVERLIQYGHEAVKHLMAISEDEINAMGFVPELNFDSIEEILEAQENGETMEVLEKKAIEIMTKSIEVSQNTTKLIDKLMKESQIALINLRAHSRYLDLEQFEFTKNFFARFNTAQLDLLDARRDLFSLASRTIVICDNIEIGINNWQYEYAAILLKNEFRQVKRLIRETKTKIHSAKGKYKALIETWVKIDEDIRVFNVKLTDGIKMEQTEYNARAKKLRVAAYSTAGVMTVGTIIADIFGCMGICTGLMVSGWGGTAIGVESHLQDFRHELAALKNQVDTSRTRIGNLETTTEKAVTLLEKELLPVIHWENAAINVDESIEFYTMAQIPTARIQFAASISDLKSAAQEYYDYATREDNVEKIIILAKRILSNRPN